MTNVYAGLAASESLCLEEITFGHETAEFEQPHALAAIASGEPKALPKPESSRNEGAVTERVEDRVIGKLSTALAGVLVEAFRDVLARRTDEYDALSCSVRQAEDRLATATECLTELSGKIDQLAEAVSDQKSAGLATQQKCEQLAAGVDSLWEASRRHESAVGDLREETQNLSSSVTDRLDALMHRLGMQHEDISALKSAASEVSPRVDTIVERLDRQAETIRSMWEGETKREAALDDLVGALTRLKGSGLLASSNVATQL